MHEFVLSDLSAGDERGVKIMARHRVSLPRDAQHHSVSRVWKRLVLRHMSPNRRGRTSRWRAGCLDPLPLEQSQLSNKVQRCVPPALSTIPLSLVAAPKNDTGDPGIPDCRQLEHPVIVIDVC
jgi:hypothetical protein